MVNGISGLNKGRGSKLHVGFQVRQETLEEGWRTYRPKRYEYNNKDEDISPKILNDKELSSFVSEIQLDWSSKIVSYDVAVQPIRCRESI